MGKLYDICIIGSGITGSLTADYFLNRGLNVIIIERGDNVYLPDKPEEYWHESWKIISKTPLITRNTWAGAEKYFDDLAEIENAHEKFAFFYNMKYGLGGSGAVWSGASWRLTPQDFRTRSLFGYGRDWPFSYKGLSPFYSKVEEIFFTSGPGDVPGWPWRNNYQYPAFKQSYLDRVVKKAFAPEFLIVPNAFSVRNLPPSEGGCVGAKTCVKRCPANARFRPDLHIMKKHLNSNNLTLLLGVPCLSVNHGKDDRIESITVWRKGKHEKIRAKYYFLAANTIENLRILLNSNLPLKNRNLLGAYFSSHGTMVLSVTMKERLFIGRGRPTTSSAINTLNHPFRDRINSYMMEVWNYDFNLGYSPKQVFLNLRRDERHWGNTLFQKTKEADNRFAAVFVFETEMRERNRITLSDRRDRFGLPLARVDFTPGRRDKETFKHLQKQVRILREKEDVREIRIMGYGLNGNHPLGGYVCGEDPKSAIIDPWMRSHDFRNLYILGGGAFNSTGALNPTHTIAALTLKALSDERLSF